MRLVSLVPVGTKVNFLRFRQIGMGLSLLLCLASAILFTTKGLNYGIDFQGGILVEVRTSGPANIGQIRGQISALGLGNIEIQEFGQSTDVLIRIERQPGGAKEQNQAVEKVKSTLGSDVDYRRIEFVGPKVSGELVEAGVTAVLLALAAMLLYIWFRFEWQFGVGAVVALVHDVLLTIGIFAYLVWNSIFQPLQRYLRLPGIPSMIQWLSMIASARIFVNTRLWILQTY